MLTYIIVSAFDEPCNLKRGISLVKQFQEDGGKLENLFTVEDVLIETGHAEDSYHLMVAGDNTNEVQKIKEKMMKNFEASLHEFYKSYDFYDKDDISDTIDFDDYSLSHRMPSLMKLTMKQMESLGMVELIQREHPYHENEFYKLTK